MKNPRPNKNDHDSLGNKPFKKSRKMNKLRIKPYCITITGSSFYELFISFFDQHNH